MSTMKRAALDALARRYPDDFRTIYQSIRDGHPLDEVTVGEWATQWLKLRERTVRPGTLDADRSAVHRWIVPTIGDQPLAGLRPADIRAVDTAAEDSGKAPTTVQRIHAVLQLMLTGALEEGHDIPQRALHVKPPSAGRSQRQAMTAEQASRILHVAMARPDSSRWVAAILQGMRPAEALGLRWSEVDLDHGLMAIEWQLKALPYVELRQPESGFRIPRGFESIQLAGSLHLVRPKTRAGMRVVPLVPWLRTELSAWRAIAPESPHDLVWTDCGAPIRQDRDRAEWRAIAEEADVWITQTDGTRRRPLLYECRHTAATLLASTGADDTTITSIVGHSSIASTQTYLHTDHKRQLEALTKASAQLGIEAAA